MKKSQKNKKPKIPLEVYTDDDNTISSDLGNVLRRWARDFGLLLAAPQLTQEQQAFLDQIRADNDMREKHFDNANPKKFSQS